MNIQNERSRLLNLVMVPAIVVFFLCSSYVLLAQEDMIAIPTPHAASLGTFGQIPVSHFTGTPNVNFPLYTLKDGNLVADVSIAYHTALVKPDHPTGWVGLGWSLVAGGSISRIPKGRNMFDENVFPDPDQAYINSKNVLSPSDWATRTKIDQADPYPNQRDLEPDEFEFNFGKYSGTFFLNYNGQWTVKSGSPVQFKVTAATAAGQVVNGFNSYALDKYYRSFTIVTEDGTTYVFGNEQGATEPVAVEFSINVTDGIYESNYIIPTTWYLTKIIAPEGNYIEFRYVRGEGMYHLTHYVTMSESMNHWNAAPCSGPLMPCWESMSQNYNFVQGYNVDLLYPAYLDEIVTSDNYKMKFSMSNSAQLKFNQAIINSHVSPLPGFPTTSVQKKLDNVQVFDRAGALIRQFNFSYTDVSTSRLFLNNYEEVGKNGEKRKFEFTYNTTPLPDFNSGQTDHWGFYKGAPSYYSDPANLMTIKEVTEANAYLMQAGILTKVKFPTGGSTEFEYEPNYYSAVAGRYPFDLTDVGTNMITGGVRIRKIISRDAGNSILSEKEYFYVKDYRDGGTQSSGILAGKPVYVAMWDFSDQIPAESYITFADRISQPLSFTQGSHITYSEVVERESGNGYTVFKYNNYDDPDYRDRPAFFTVGIASMQKQFPFISMSYARGSLKSEQYYNESGYLQKEVIYQYQNLTPASSDPESVRAQQCMTFTWHKLGTAYVDYTWCPYLVSKTTKECDINGENPVISTETYAYNAYDQLATQSMIQSNKQGIVTSYKYPLDYTSAEQTPIINTMCSMNMVKPFIEKKVYIDNATKDVIDAEYHQYSQVNTNIVRAGKIIGFNSKTPIALSSFSFTDNSMVRDRVFFSYSASGDDAGNLVEINKSNDYPVSYIWGYGGEVPIAKVINAQSDQVRYASFESDHLNKEGGWSIPSAIRSGLSFTGNKAYTLSDGAVTTTGVPAGTYNLSFWKRASGGTISFIGLNNSSLKQTYNKNGWTFELWEVQAAPAIFGLSGTATIDDLRLQPLQSMMTTYTYGPSNELTSQTDFNGEIQYYDYDGLGRLTTTRDNDRNILQHIQYQYKHP